MNCFACKDLYRAFQRTHTSYLDAYSSAFFKVSAEIAAMLHVAMERARSGSARAPTGLPVGEIHGT